MRADTHTNRHFGPWGCPQIPTARTPEVPHSCRCNGIPATPPPGPRSHLPRTSAAQPSRGDEVPPFRRLVSGQSQAWRRSHRMPPPPLRGQRAIQLPVPYRSRPPEPAYGGRRRVTRSSQVVRSSCWRHRWHCDGRTRPPYRHIPTLYGLSPGSSPPRGYQAVPNGPAENASRPAIWGMPRVRRQGTSSCSRVNWIVAKGQRRNTSWATAFDEELERQAAAKALREWHEFRTIEGTHLAWRRVHGRRTQELVAEDGTLWATLRQASIGSVLARRCVISAHSQEYRMHQTGGPGSWVPPWTKKKLFTEWELVDAEGRQVLRIAGHHFNLYAGSTVRMVGHYSPIELPVRGPHATAIMRAVESSAPHRQLVHYRLIYHKIFRSRVEVVVTPDAEFVPGIALFVAVTSGLLLRYFRKPSGGS